MSGAGTTQIYEYVVRPDEDGWFYVMWRYASGGSWQVVAHVLGEKRAEIVRDALSAEANERG